jgi:hypothetical protein
MDKYLRAAAVFVLFVRNLGHFGYPSLCKHGGRWDAAQSKSGDLMLPPPRKRFLPSTSPHVRNGADCGLKIGGDVTAALSQKET